ncbi:hypothetical protein [Persicitalea jodogahamensis]|uniref:Uncharacterized protein n=1 Tax=Persicitalea jodogahamensis TaxID=402147 RepID=A0A8J3GCH9_9BACT|nr:hypothetical protein [Persicitalea jodogahamensis]GHB84889.1 hypothetical protein GCM10007390_45160 [Persicitalea jodogahamensis]
MRTKLYFCLLLLSIGSCKTVGVSPNLVPSEPGKAANYWCTWYWQNYLILKGQPVTNPSASEVFTNPAAREEINEETVFGPEGMARVMLPDTRSDYFFLIDHGWQDKSLPGETFFTMIMDTTDFPRYASLAPKDRIRQMNADIKALGWRGLALWVRGNPTDADMRKFVEWSKYAGIEYWKIDGGDTNHFAATRIKDEIYPALTLEHVSGSKGPLNPQWSEPGKPVYPSVYETDNGSLRDLALKIIESTDVFRTYDAAPLLVSATTMQRVHDVLSQTTGNAQYRAMLNIQDDCNIAAALGLLVGVKRHPMKTPRLYKGKDFHFQIAGNRHVDQRLDEMDRLARWQRIAPPMTAGYGTYQASQNFLIDSTAFSESDTWMTDAHGKMVRQSAPAIMARNIDLPEVRFEGLAPYVMASKFPGGATAIATEGRVTAANSWIHPRAAITLTHLEAGKPIGIFGHYKSLTLVFEEDLSAGTTVYAQDLLAEQSADITKKVTLSGKTMTIPGEVIDQVGTASASEGDISAPGLVLKVVKR